jgi:uncharacterized Zn-binding protein involved in type VI secretion
VPGAHRHDDSRYCGASTIVEGQNNVFVNNKLWAVDNDPCTHENGNLKPIYGAKNVYINGKLVICAVGDTAYGSDNLGHDPGPVDPKGHSSDVIVYGGGAGGT